MKNVTSRKNFINKIILSVVAIIIGSFSFMKFNIKKIARKNIKVKINPLSVKRVNKV
ncbi:hypothetical protein [Rosettibacter firmus]|uniref:hypothetical protein n=1 Tax=Rosettibacter firmus TaxID=3111522 RepID=UPI00336C22A1